MIPDKRYPELLDFVRPRRTSPLAECARGVFASFVTRRPRLDSASPCQRRFPGPASPLSACTLRTASATPSGSWWRGLAETCTSNRERADADGCNAVEVADLVGHTLAFQKVASRASEFREPVDRVLALRRDQPRTGGRTARYARSSADSPSVVGGGGRRNAASLRLP